MLYLNQLEYPQIVYNHNMAHGGPPEGRTSVRTSGCGLCCACMVVDHLAGKELPIEDCVKLSEENGANLDLGTDMRVLAPIVAEKYDLAYAESQDKDEMLAWLKAGGEAIAWTAGDHDSKIGLFSNRGHYILLTAVVDDWVQIMDPSYKEGKFAVAGRVERVRVETPFVYAMPDDVQEECRKDRPKYYMFKKK